MPTYTVNKPFRGDDGRDLAAGDTVELTERQAKYLLLAGKIAVPPAESAARPATGKKTAKADLAANTEKES